MTICSSIVPIGVCPLFHLPVLFHATCVTNGCIRWIQINPARELNCWEIWICSRSILKSSSLAPLFQIWPISKEAATAAAKAQFWQGASGVAAKQRRQQQRGCCSDSRFLRTVQRFLIKRRAKSSNKGFLSGPERRWHRFSRTSPSTAASSRAVTCNSSQGTSGWCYLRLALLCSKQIDMGCQFGIRCVVCHERILPIRATFPLNYGLIFSSSGQYLLQNSSIQVSIHSSSALPGERESHWWTSVQNRSAFSCRMCPQSQSGPYRPPLHCRESLQFELHSQLREKHHLAKSTDA